MSWESLGEKRQKIEIIQLVQDSVMTSWHKYDPKKLRLSIDKIAEGTSIIINTCTFETFKTKANIPYKIKSSSEKGIIEEIYATVRDGDFLNRVWVKPEGREKKQIFSQDFKYTRESSDSPLPEFDDYIFSSELSVPSTSIGIFNPKIQAHLEELAQESHAELESDIYRCIKFMKEEAIRL